MIENELINKAIEYIFNNIDSKLTVDDVANYCNVSKYHFSRLFKKEVGEGVYSFIKRNKIALSAVTLKVDAEKAITEVGLDCGYSASNYATVFKELLNTSPVQFRTERCWEDGKVPHPFFDIGYGVLKSYEEYDKNTTIKQLSELTIHYRRFIGNYAELKMHWIKFMSDFEHIVTDKTLWIERSFSDPDIMDLDKCVCDICITVPKDSELKPISTIPGGKYAVYHFAGHKKDIYTEYQGMFTVWLPNSGYSLYCGEIYDVIHKFDANEDTIEMDICIPIE